jgi:hypothetical protein
VTEQIDIGEDSRRRVSAEGRCSIRRACHEAKALHGPVCSLFRPVGQLSQIRRGHGGIGAEQLKSPCRGVSAAIVLRAEQEVLDHRMVIEYLPVLHSRELGRIAGLPLEPLHQERDAIRADIIQQLTCFPSGLHLPRIDEVGLINRLKATLEFMSRRVPIPPHPKRHCRDQQADCTEVDFELTSQPHAGDSDMRRRD